MTMAEFLFSLYKQGITVRVEAGNLKISAPDGVLSLEMQSQLRERKTDIISYLTEKQNVNHKDKSLQRADRSQAIRASSSQRGLWLQYQIEGTSNTYNIPLVYRFKGKVNIPALERTLEYLVARHESLRMSFESVESTPYLVIADHVDWKLDIRRANGPIEHELAELAALPFLLDQSPLFRAHLWTDLEADHTLLLSFHHIILDEWATGVFERELTNIYARFAAGDAAALAPLELDYVDYAFWQQNWLKSAEYEQGLSYWKESLQGAPDLLDLPTDHPRPAVQTYRGKKIEKDIEQRLVGKLQELAHREGVTLFVVLHAAFVILLGRYSRQEEVIVGIQLANRPRKELEDMLGYFINTLPLRVKLNGNTKLSELLQRIHQVRMDALNHQSVPFDKLVEELHPRRDPGFSPLFQVVFDFINIPLPGVQMENCEVTSYYQDIDNSIYDLVLIVHEQSPQWLMKFQYNTDLFETATAERMLAHYRRILEWMVSGPTGGIQDFDFLMESERRQHLVEWNDTAVDYPRGNCLHELIEEQAAKTPDAAAVEFGDQRTTYRELNSRANRLAHRLRKLGAGVEVPIGLYLERSGDLVAAMLGILKSGSPYVPLDSVYPLDRRADIILDSGMKILVTQSALVTDEFPADLKVLVLDEEQDSISDESEKDPGRSATAENLAYIIYTSGSTGRSKGVEITHRSVVNCLLSFADQLDISAKDRMLAVTTPTFDISVLELMLPLCLGGCVVVVEKEDVYDGRLLGEKLEKKGISVMQATPSTWQILIEAGWTGNSALKVLCGGEAFPSNLAQQLLERCGQVYNLYGPTETTIWSSYSQVKAGEKITIGKPIANTKLYVLDAKHQLVPVGVTGELYIGGEGLARGYHDRPELTAEKFVLDPFQSNGKERIYKSGDLVRRLPNGELEYVGRADFQVKIRGYRIELGEIETLLGRHADVQQAVVLVREDQPGEKRLVGYIISRPGKNITAEEVRDYLKDSLPGYMIPSMFAFLDAFPQTANGKVDRKALPMPEARPVDMDQQKPETETEAHLAKIWAEVLKLPLVGINDNFFEIGGNSLLAVRLMAVIERELSQRIPVVELFRSPTIRQLARVIQKTKTTLAWTPLVEIQRGGHATPLFILHSQSAAMNLARELGPRWTIYGLEPSGLEGETEFDTSIEQMAERYLKALKEVQPNGPYRLAGYCAGGVVAYEMAFRLEAEGQHVALLVELDGHAGQSKEHSWKDWFTDLKESLPFWIRKYIRGMDLLTAFLRAIKMLNKRRAVLKGENLPQEFDFQNQDDDEAFMQRLQQHMQLLMAALREYRPRPYPGRVTVFSAKWKFPYQLLFQRADQALGWKKLAQGGVDVYSFDGEHTTFYLPPHLSAVASVLQGILERLDEEERAPDRLEDS